MAMTGRHICWIVVEFDLAPWNPYMGHLALKGKVLQHPLYEGHLESKERFAIQRYLLIIGKKQNMQVLSHTFTYFST